jgi:hypothetical protein
MRSTSHRIVQLAIVAFALLLCLTLTACNDGADQENDLPVPNSASDYEGENYRQVKSELESAGFTDIEFVVLDDLKIGLLTKDGEIEHIAINGDADFSKGDRYSTDSKIVITYHTFSDDEVEQTPTPDEASPPETPSDTETTEEEMSEQPSDTASSPATHKYYDGTEKRTKKGYTDGETIEKKDIHFGWKLGRFYVNDFTRVIDDKEDNPVFLKTLGDEIAFGYQLVQDINKLKGEEKLSIEEDNKGYDPSFGITTESAFGRGALIIKRTDYQGETTTETFTDFLPAKTTGADAEVNTYEEGDYEVALDYKIKNDGFLFIDSSYYYQTLFKFKVRNGNCMVYPFDVRTKSELANGAITADGYYIDLTKSRYLVVDVKKEVLADGVNGLDMRFNKPAIDGEQYVDEGIYTITVNNPYTGESTIKKICVGTDSTLINYFKRHQ